MGWLKPMDWTKERIHDESTFRFIGNNWEMELTPRFFWERSLAACRKAIKYAFEDPEQNYYDLAKLLVVLNEWTNNKETPNVTETRYKKFTKLIEMFTRLEEYPGQTITNP